MCRCEREDINFSSTDYLHLICQREVNIEDGNRRRMLQWSVLRSNQFIKKCLKFKRLETGGEELPKLHRL